MTTRVLTKDAHVDQSRIRIEHDQGNQRLTHRTLPTLEERLTGCLVGTAVADSLGLPYEGLSRSRAAKILGPADRHRFVFGRGMVSDDTDHICMVAQALIFANGDLAKFQINFARRLKYWFATLPAGVGIATAKSCLKLWFFSSPQTSGVFSAGNGPAMRAAIFGAYFDDIQQLQEFLKAATVVTHTDPKAYHGAIAVALAAMLGRQNQHVKGDQFLQLYSATVTDAHDELLPKLKQAVDSVRQGETVLEFAAELGCHQKVSGYVLETVPMAIHAWLSHQRDYRSAVTSIIACGGDADTTAAIVGGIVGATVGANQIPEKWRANVIEWPRTLSWIRRLGHRLATAEKEPTAQKKPPRLSVSAVLIRNVIFLLIVLVHGFKRLLPPYEKRCFKHRIPTATAAEQDSN